MTQAEPLCLGILGAGSWGTALAVLWAAHEPWLWDHNAARANELSRTRVQPRFLPGVRLPDSVRVTGDLDATLQNTSVLVVATPSHTVRDLARRLAASPALVRDAAIVNVAKGLEEGTCASMTQVLRQELPRHAGRTVALVGPSHAEEVARHMPTTVVVAGDNEELLLCLQRYFSTESFRVYTNTDLVGVELAVSVKNIIAIAAGICDGLGFGDNSKGALLTRGLAEMARLGLARGARAETFAGLAGLGDLVTTATSRHSRNRNLGEAIGRGSTLEQALAAMTQVAEGVRTTRAVLQLAKEHGVEMPITMQVHAVLFENKNPKEAIRDLMLRSPKPETWSATKGAT